MTTPPFTLVDRNGHPPANTLVMIDQTAGTVTPVDATAPHLRVDDLSPHRGDGIFETALVTWDSPGQQSEPVVHARKPHFDRFKNSAALLELPVPDEELFDRAIAQVLHDFRTQYPEITMVSVRYAMTRGVEGTSGNPTAWAITLPVDTNYANLRERGLKVMTLDRGYDAYFGADAPWQLIGAKTLSYATNQAAGRWVRSHGADETLYVSHDGIVLEGPSCNLLVKRGNEFITPEPKAGLLHGTTQQTVFNQAAHAGYLCSYQDLRPADLADADALWMLSSTRMAVPVAELDGASVPVDGKLTAQLVDWIISAG